MAKKMVKKNKELEVTHVDPVKELASRTSISDPKVAVRQEIIKSHMTLVQAIAANIAAGGKAPPGVAFNDLVSYGVEGLIKAWESFDRERGVQFKVYASYRVRGEILDRIRKEWKYRNPGSYKAFQGRAYSKVAETANELSDGTSQAGAEGMKDIVSNSAIVYLLSLEDIEVQSGLQGTQDPAEEVIGNMNFSRERTILWDEIKKLTTPEKMLVNMFYVEDKNQKDIAEALGFSKSKISRLHVQVLNKLKGRLKRRLEE